MFRMRARFKNSRSFIHLLILLQAFFMVGGAEAVEARQQGILRAQAEGARMARTFGLTAEQWQVSAPSWIERSTDAVAGEVQEVLDHSRTEVTRLLDEIREPEIEVHPVVHIAQDGGSGGGGPVGEGFSKEAQPQRQIKPYIPRRSALEAGEGERTVARAPRSAKLLPGLGGSREDDLPLRVMQRTAQTVESSALPAGQKISSAIAPASSPLTQSRGAKSNKAIAPEIVALAASLDNSPAKIFRYVHDQITYDPKWGVDSTPLGTLWEGRGTSWDQAWLLQELLVAAGVDARLEWGQVEIPPSLLTNLTGIDDPIRAGDFLTTAGLEVLLVIQGSQVSAARFPHVWVKAHLDYIPNRGVTLGTADTWIRMDPSITTHERTDGLRLDQDVPFVLGDHLLSGTELSPRQDYEAALLAHVADQGLPVASLDDTKSLNRQVADDFPFVPGTLRAKIVSAAGESETVPATFEQDVEVQIREEGGGALLTWTTTASNLYGKRLETVWLGATSSDQAALDLYGGIFATPPYEVELRPTLRLDGVEVASGTAIGSAEDAEIQLTLTPPDGSGAGDGIATVAGWDLFAGEHGVLTVDYGRAPPELADRYAQEALNAAGNDFEMEGWQLAQAASTYLNALGGDLTHLVDLSWHRLLTFNTAVFAVKRGAVSTSPDGTPQTFSPGPLALDVGAMPLAVMPVDGVQTSTVPTLELLGSQGSFREGEALAGVFGGEHLTAMTFLTRAVREGQGVTKVDLSNLDEALAAAEISSDAKGAIRFAVEQLGMEAWISEAQIESNTFQTTGYILIDPSTGSGGYFVTFERRFTPLDGAVTFHNPIDLDVITAPTDVIATIDAEGIESWTLSTRPVGGSGSTVIATGTGPVDNTVLGQFDPTLLLNGMHDIVLTGQNAAGEPVTGRISVVVDGKMKVGNFTLSYVDLEVPISGLDLQVLRTYDSRDKRQGDFGVGWNLAIHQGSYRNNRPPGDGWQFQTGFLPCDSILESKSHRTVIRLSDREVYQFALRLKNGAPTLGGCFGQAEFIYVEGPQPDATLEIIGATEVFYANGSDQVVVPDTQEPYVPQNVRMRTRDGRFFHLNLETGVTRLEDGQGNALDLTPSGVTHSSGRGLEFIRDSEGRIETIRDIQGRANIYTYDAAGDLVSFTDRAGETTRYTYGPDHYLQEIENALGVRAVRTEYDADGRVIRMIDASGHAVTLDHDLEGRREIVTNRLGRFRIAEYDARGNVIREVDEAGSETLRTYDTADRVLSETDALGQTTSYAYNGAGDLTRVTDPLGGTTEFGWDGEGRLTTVRDARGEVTTQNYDAEGRLDSVRDAEGNLTTYKYNGKGELTEIRDPLGAVTRYQFDANGNPIRKTDALGQVTEMAYDTEGNLTTLSRMRTLPDGTQETLTTGFQYDELDRLVGSTAPDGSSVSATLDPLGRVLTTQDRAGRITRYTYDDEGRRVSTTRPDGVTLGVTYDAEGRVTERQDAEGNTVRQTLDPLGRILALEMPDGVTLQATYDAIGQVQSVIDPNGNTTLFDYDAVGNLTQVTDPLGNATTFSYDLGGNQESVTLPGGQTTRYEYDGVGRRQKTIFPDDSEQQVVFDALGRRIAVIDAAGYRTEMAYDALSRLTTITDALGGVTSYSYDESSNLIRQVDANGHGTSLEYDPLGRLLARVLPDGARESFTYGADGRVVAHTDRNGGAFGFTYDVLGRPIQRTLPDGSTVDTTYDARGQRASVTDARGTTQFDYDVRGRLIRKTDPTGHQLAYAYDPVGNLTGQTATIGGQSYSFSYSHDAANRLTSVEGPGGGSHQLSYSPNGQLIGLMYPNGVNTTWDFDDLGRLVDLQTRDASSAVLDGYHYTLSARGLRQRIDGHDGRSRLFSYDALSRLTEERHLNADQSLLKATSYQYDPVGNRLEKITEASDGSLETLSYNYDVRNRLVAEGDVLSTWDANGNLLSRGDRNFTWDSENRLKSVTEGADVLAEADYDADGELVMLRELGEGGAPESKHFLVDSAGFLSHAIAEYDAQGSVQEVYTRAGDKLLGAYQPTLGTTHSLHADGLGSIRTVTNGSGGVVARDEYGAFGERDSVTVGAYGFAGERFAASVGLGYHRARWLDHGSGRFLSSDPFPGSLGSPLSQHRYLYAHANPVHHTDPTGLFIGGGGMSEFNVATAVQGIMVGLNAVSLVGNVFYALAYGKRAARALLAGEIFDGIGYAIMGILYAGAAAASLVGLLTAFTPIPPPSGFAGGFALALGGGARATQPQAIWTAVASNQKILEWALAQVLPAIIGSHLMFATHANGGVDSGDSGGDGGSGGNGGDGDPPRSDDPGLDEFIDRLEEAGIEVENVNVKINGTDGNTLGEVDIVTKNAVIQYKNGPSSAYAVIEQVTVKTEPHVTRPVVTFINDTTKAGARTVNGAGGKILVTNDFNLLVEILK